MIFQLPSFWCWKMPIPGSSERTVTLDPSLDSSSPNQSDNGNINVDEDFSQIECVVRAMPCVAQREADRSASVLLCLARRSTCRSQQISSWLGCSASRFNASASRRCVLYRHRRPSWQHSRPIPRLAFEIRLFGWMALTYFVLFPNPHLMPNQPLYWFMMQIGMVFGFFTSYPMNRLLIKWGTKEAMG